MKTNTLLITALVFCIACSASPKINVGNEPDGSAAGSGGASGSAGLGGFGGGDNTLTALITEPPSEMAIEVVTISCAGECKQVLAIASGGNDPYTFAWNDGVTTAAREMCPDDDTTFAVTVTDTAFIDDEFQYEAQTVTASVEARVLTCSTDGGVDGGSDARSPDCDLGELESDVHGALRFFTNRAPLPAGRYRISYVDGCVKWGPQGNYLWTVHGPARLGGPGNFVFVRDNEANILGVPPGTHGFTAQEGAYETLAACVQANRALPPMEFDFPGGMLGIVIFDGVPLDNIGGEVEGGRNPTWRLQSLGTCD